MLESFYGGKNGQPFKIQKIFSNYGELEADIALGWSSTVYQGQFVLIFYGDKGDEESDYDTNLEADIGSYGRSYNNSIWQKSYEETDDNPTGFTYTMIADISGGTPTITVGKTIAVGADQNPDVSVDNSNPDAPVLTFEIPVSNRWWTGTLFTGEDQKQDSTLEGVIRGDFYLNTDTGELYKCSAVSGSNSTWDYQGLLVGPSVEWKFGNTAGLSSWASSAKTEDVYFDTDTGTIYQKTSSSYEKVGSIIIPNLNSVKTNALNPYTVTGGGTGANAINPSFTIDTSSSRVNPAITANLPKAPMITIEDEVESLAPSSNPTVNVTYETTGLRIKLGIPRGQTGAGLVVNEGIYNKGEDGNPDVESPAEGNCYFVTGDSDTERELWIYANSQWTKIGDFVTGAVIDDSQATTNSVYSSSKTVSEITSRVNTAITTESDKMKWGTF